MATVYGGYDTSAGYDAYRAVMDYSTSQTDTQWTVSITGKVQSGYGADSLDNFALSLTIGDSTESKSSSSYMSAGSTVTFGSKSRTYSRGHSAVNCLIKAYAKNDGTYTGWTGSSTAQATVTIPAKPSYAVTYNANGGSGAPSGQTKWHGETLTLSTTKPTRTGYAFLGWSTSSTATSATYAAGGSYTANASATLYAVWKANTYAVTYNANGGSGAPSSQTKTYDVDLTLSSTKPTRTGYTFQGWATSSTSATVAYSPGARYTTNAALALYAVWRINTYTVSYNANGGSGAPSSQTKTYGVDLTLSSTKPTRTGYTFRGWGTSSTATAVSYAAGAKYTSNASATLYALWSAITYTVSYNANGGTGAPSAQTKTHGVTLKLSSTKPTYSGYTFMGWATSSSNASAGTVAYAAGANYTANQSVTLYAVWKRTVTYNANGGSGAPSAQTGYKGSSTTLSSTIPTQTGFTFLGWNTSSNGSGTHYSPGVTYSGISTTLYAMWRRITISVVSGTARRNGTTCSFSAKWVCQSTVGGTVSSSAKYSDTDSIPTKTLTLSGTTTGTKVAGTNLSGTVSGSFTCPESTVGRALVTVTFTDTYSTAYSGTHVATAQLSVTVPKAFRLLTAKHGASWTDGDGDTYSEGLAIGLLASLIGRLEVGLTTLFRKAVTVFANVSVASESIDRDGTLPSTNTYGKQFRLADKDGDAVGYMDGYQLTTGETGVRFVAFAGPSGDAVYNAFRVGKLADGTNVYHMTDPAAFRIASNTAAVSDQSAQSVNISPGSGSTDFAIYANVTNSSSSDYGDRVALWAKTDGIALYNSTNSSYDWNLTLPVSVENGGSGRSSVYKSTTVSQVISAASGITVSSVTYAEWGKVAQLSVAFTGMAASTGSQTVGTVASGKRPVYNVYATDVSSSYAVYALLTTAGALTVYWGTAPSTTGSYTARFIYILA